MSDNSDDSNGDSKKKEKRSQYKPIFLDKVFKILEREDVKHIIAWSDDGLQFEIKDQVKFIAEILPEYFKHNNFASFIRQLNMYDFQKTNKRTSNKLIYSHPLFRKDKPF